MTLAWLTDPHLDHLSAEMVAKLFADLRQAPGEAVVLTGDVSVAPRLHADLEHLASAAARPLYFVLGNHDHYGTSIATLRDQVIDLSRRVPTIRWLPPAGVVALNPTTALIGVDGWADGRYGDPIRTPLVLNDDRMIAELEAQSSRIGKLAVRRALADADAGRLATLLQRAAAGGSTRIIVATHVPPFVAGLAPGSRIAHLHWHPLLVCGATGDVLRRFADATPEVSVEVLAGHTHAAHAVQLSANLHLRVGGARYGSPSRIEVV